MCIQCLMGKQHVSASQYSASATSSLASGTTTSTHTTSPWYVNDQTPDNPFGKSDDYEGYLDYLGALNRSLTPEIAAGTLKINVSDLNDHPEYKAAAIGALQMRAMVTPLKFEIVDDRPYDRAIDWMQVVSPEIGEECDGNAFSSNRLVNIGQRFHDSARCTTCCSAR